MIHLNLLLVLCNLYRIDVISHLTLWEWAKLTLAQQFLQLLFSFHFLLLYLFLFSSPKKLDEEKKMSEDKLDVIHVFFLLP